MTLLTNSNGFVFDGEMDGRTNWTEHGDEIKCLLYDIPYHIHNICMDIAYTVYLCTYIIEYM